MGVPGRFSELRPAWREAFDLAWESWCAGSLGIGAVLVDGGGATAARGRNRVLEEALSGRIAGSLLAHAEMDAFAALGLRTAEGLTLYSTVEPCLMCMATAIAMRTSLIAYAATDPVFEGLAEALSAHSYMAGRMPARERLDDPTLEAFAAVLPLANRVWSRPGQAPRAEWVQSHSALWVAANRLIDEGMLTSLVDKGADVVEAIQVTAPTLLGSGAI
jgi:tRNA(adenine34) deaminase